MSSPGSLSLITIGTAALSNGLVTGAAYYGLDAKLSGYSSWQKAAMASAIGTLSLGLVAIILTGTATARTQ